jgi:hypothetical protein
LSAGIRRGYYNPARSELVKFYQDGYGNMLHHEGVKVECAKVFSEEKLDNLVAYLTEQLGKAKGMEQCVLAMHWAAVLYLWKILARGKECGEVQQDQIDPAEGTVYPGWTKTVRQEPSARIEQAVPGEKLRLTFLEAASELVRVQSDNGIDIGKTGHLFRAQNRSRNGFEDKPIASSALRKRTQKRLQEAGLYEGETLHSFRRSALPDAAIELKYDIKKLMDFGGWKTYLSFKLYVEKNWRR